MATLTFKLILLAKHLNVEKNSLSVERSFVLIFGNKFKLYLSLYFYMSILRDSFTLQKGHIKCTRLQKDAHSPPFLVLILKHDIDMFKVY